MTDARHFPFRFSTLFRLAARPFGITPGNSGVVVDDTDVTITYGPWTLSTPRANVTGATVSGPYTTAKVIGPPHLSGKDRGVTFASNGDRGTCLTFADPVPAILPVSLLRHPGATVTVDDPAGLAELFGAD